MLHSLVLQLHGCLMALLIGGAGELAQADVAHSISKHESGVHAMDGNFSAGYLKRNLLMATAHGDCNLATGRALDAVHHGVLRELDAGYHFVVYLQEAVSGKEPHLF